MINFSGLSIAKKIRLIVTFTTALAMILASCVLITLEINNYRSSLMQRIDVISQVVASHTRAALIFNDKETAEQLLASLDTEESVLQAVLFTQEGTHLAHFSDVRNRQPVVDDINQLTQEWRESGYHFDSAHLHVFTPVLHNQQLIGTLYTLSTLSPLYNKVSLYLASVLTILLVITALVYLASARLHGRISQPIAKLMEGIKIVAHRQDYSLRIEKAEQDEIGEIIDGFNNMIGKIQQRNDEIHDKQLEIEQYALYDSLTGLINRRHLNQILDDQINHCKRSQMSGAVLFIDLDHFKNINDSLGHNIGDQLLIEVARRIETAIRKTDTPARLGGDEFIVILNDINRKDAASVDAIFKVAEMLRKSIAEPYNISDRTLYTSPSIGISLFDDASQNAEELIMQADMAMYRAKESGRNRISFFSHDMHLLAQERQQVEHDLYQTLQNGGKDLALYYQPQVNQHGHLTGVEALVRWFHPERGLLMPARFIPIAESTGLIHELGSWVLEQACAQLKQWRERNINLTIAVNISPPQFLQNSFVERLEQIIDQMHLHPCRLELEITEGVLLNNTDDIVGIMHRLQRKGVKFSIDDFGTGYSSLRYIKRLPLQKLKIDRSFVTDVTTDLNDAAIVKATISIADHLGLEVIAEGVETHAQREMLIQSGCRAFQGYLFGKPEPITTIEQRLKHPA